MKEEMQMSRVHPITIKVLQEKSRRTGPAEGVGGQDTVERLTIEEINNGCLYCFWCVEPLSHGNSKSGFHSVALHQEKEPGKSGPSPEECTRKDYLLNKIQKSAKCQQHF